MAEIQALLIGGPFDGQRQIVDSADEFIVRVKPTETTKEQLDAAFGRMMTAPFDPTNVTFAVEKVVYKRELFQGSGTCFYSIWRCEHLTVDDMIHKLIDNYRAPIELKESLLPPRIGECDPVNGLICRRFYPGNSACTAYGGTARCIRKNE